MIAYQHNADLNSAIVPFPNQFPFFQIYSHSPLLYY